MPDRARPHGAPLMQACMRRWAGPDLGPMLGARSAASRTLYHWLQFANQLGQLTWVGEEIFPAACRE
jgi:hypothetical protein